MKCGPASEEAHYGGQYGKEDCLHPGDRIAGYQRKSLESIGRRLLVGTTQQDFSSVTVSHKMPPSACITYCCYWRPGQDSNL